jgi:hypothetical protein
MKQSTRRAAIAAIALCLAAGAVAAVVWWRRPSPEPALPAITENAVDEAEALAASHGLARRDGTTLLLRQKSGEVVALSDHLQCGDLPCPKPLAVSYRYLGWDERIGGYRLMLTMAGSQQMVLTYGEDEPVLIDARHAAELNEPQPLPAAPPPAAKTDESLNEWLADLTNDREQTEAKLITAHHDQVSREGGVLALSFGDHRRLLLEDDLVCGQLACPPQISRSFDYIGESPDGQFHIVHVEGNESEEGLLIDRQGAVLVTIGVPSFSPDGKFAVAAVSDLEASAPRRLEVWGLAGGKANLVFSVAAREEDDTVYELVGWADASHLRLKRGPWGGDQRSAVMLVRDNAGWHIEEGGGGD